MTSTPWLAAGALLAALAAGWVGHGIGVDRTDARWLAREAQRIEAERARQRADFAAADRASTAHENARRAIADRERTLRRQLHAALNQPAPQCPGVPLADVVVPAAALRSLRDAGAPVGTP